MFVRVILIALKVSACYTHTHTIAFSLAASVTALTDTNLQPGKLHMPIVTPNIFLNSIFFVATPQGMWDLSSQTSEQTPNPCSGSAES